MKRNPAMPVPFTDAQDLARALLVNCIATWHTLSNFARSHRQRSDERQEPGARFWAEQAIESEERARESAEMAVEAAIEWSIEPESLPDRSLGSETFRTILAQFLRGDY